MPKTKVTITAETEALPQLQRNQLAIMDLLEVGLGVQLEVSEQLAGSVSESAVVAVISYVYRKFLGSFPRHPARYVGWGA